jgi:hypothetical protein
MSFEIERKFLVRGNHWQKLATHRTCLARPIWPPTARHRFGFVSRVMGPQWGGERSRFDRSTSHDRRLPRGAQGRHAACLIKKARCACGQAVPNYLNPAR